MTDITDPADQDAREEPEGAASGPQPRLSKEERRALLARIEREASRSRAETHEKILQRAEQALQDGNREQAQRLADHLDKTNPNLQGLAELRQKLAGAEKVDRQRSNVKKAEEMLLRYIQERRKQAAEFALEALSEVAPNHPRLSEFKIWVRDLDEEVAYQRRLDQELEKGRQALQSGDLEVASQHLKTLQGLDVDATATVLMAADLERAQRGQEASADIESIKNRFESLLQDLRIEDAEAELQRLAAHELPKITIDQLRLRLDEARSGRRDQKEMEEFEAGFAEHLAAGRWHEARDLAQRLGQRFQGHPRAARMFYEVNEREAEERRHESIRQGVESLERFIAQGLRQEAELALKLLQGKIEAERLAKYEERIRSL